MKYRYLPHIAAHAMKSIIAKPLAKWGALLALCLWLPTHLAAQGTPVLVTPQLTPPYSIFLPDYGAPEAEQLRINVLLRDLTLTDYQVRLRFVIEGAGIRIESRLGATADPIFLNPGTPVVLSGADLAAYFQPQNLNFSGISRRDYERNGGALPDGFYRFCIQVVDFRRPDVVVSNQGCSNAWIIQNDPPRINTPLCNSTIDVSVPQNIQFQWLPMHANSPNAAFTTEYNFRLVEIWPATRNPNDAINASTPIFETTTNSTTLFYGPAEPALVPGRDYAWRVQAVDTEGRDLFKNDGYSEVCRFTFGDVAPLAPPANITTQVESDRRVRVNWDLQDLPDAYRVEYRLANSPGALWFGSETTDNYLVITDGRPETNYEVRVRSEYGQYKSEWSTTQYFSTLPSQTFECGNQVNVPAITNTTPLATARTGDVFQVGLFEMYVTKITGGNGNFSGQGYVTIPYLGFNVNVTYTNITVNENGQVTDGSINALSDGIEAFRSQWDDLVEDAPEAGIVDAADGLPETTVEISGEIDSVYINDSGQITIVDTQGNVETVTEDVPAVTVVDSNGQTSIVDNQGNVTPVDTTSTVVTGGSTGGSTSGGVSSWNGTSNTLNNGPPDEDLNPLQIKLRDALQRRRTVADSTSVVNRGQFVNHKGGIEAILLQSGMDRYLVTGINDEYLQEGMSRLFADPDTSNDNDDQPDAIKRLEAAFVNLYYADKDLQLNLTLAGLLNDYLANEAFNTLSTQLTESINLLTDAEKEEIEENEQAALTYIQEFLANKLSTDLANIDTRQGSLSSQMPAEWWAYAEMFGTDATEVQMAQMMEATALSSGMKPRRFFSSKFAFAPQHMYTAQGDTLVSRIHALHDAILESGKIAGQMAPDAEASLPMGIMKQVGGLNYLIAIDGMAFTPQGATLNAYVSLDVPNSERRIAFAGRNIGFHPGGLTSGGTSTKLVLVEDQTIPMGQKVSLVLTTADSKNYVEWDCNGFKAINIKGYFEFSSNTLVGIKPDGTADSNKKIKASFETNMTDWGTMLAMVSIDPFMVPKLKGMAFEVNEAWVDYSDLANPAGIRFPSGYSGVQGGSPNLWQGFYLKRVTITLPKELETNDGRRKTLNARNLLIDDQGVTGAFSAANLINFDKGSMNNWPFTVDSLGVQIETNQLVGGAFSGRLRLPVFDDDSPVNYAAVISEGNNGKLDYLFTLKPTADLNADVFSAKFTLAANSSITIRTVNGKFKPEAKLHGSVTVEAALKGNSKARFNGVTFQNLALYSEAPYIRGGTFDLAANESSGDKKLAKFPITLEKLGFSFNDKEMALTVGVAVHLSKAEDKGFSGATTVKVIGESYQDGSRLRWRYKKTELKDIFIDIDADAYSIKGALSLYNEDPTFGNGFRGAVEARFSDIAVSCTAQFGNKDGLRYWYVDGKVLLNASSSIPLGNSGLAIFGFMGGLYYHMEHQNPDIVAPGGYEEAAEDDTPDTSIGGTASGAKYVPSRNVKWGFKAGLTLGTLAPAVFNADAAFEMAFRSGGGLAYVKFMGDAYLMTPLNKRSKNVPFYADLDVIYDNVNGVFHANMDVYVNVAGIIKGVQPNNLAGSMVIHADSEDWYVHIGSPDKRVGLQFIGLMRTQSYFQAGTVIDDFPAPPEKVQSIMGDIDLDLMRDENQLKTGGGIAFGSSLEVSTGKLQVLVFYGEFNAGIGFDIMLRDYKDARCKGSSSPLGINGWYASGQAWAYIEGRIGIRVNLKFIKGEFEILGIKMAAVVQAKLPRPTYMFGVVGGEYRILGGLIKGRCRFKVSIGEECEIEGGGAVNGIRIIAEVTPADAEKDVSVFNAPQVAFNVSVNKEFSVLNDDMDMKSYRAKLDYFEVRYNNQLLEGNVQWNDPNNKSVAIFKPYETLPELSQLEVKVKVHWQEKVNGSWRDLQDSKGNVEFEVANQKFNTGKAPDYIDRNNVLYSYPVENQYSFLKNESSKGYITMDLYQGYLFKGTIDGKKYVYKARFKTPGQPGHIDVPLNPNRNTKSAEFNIPGNLINQKIYTVEVVRVPDFSNAVVDANVTSQDRNAVTQGDSIKVDFRERDIEGLYDYSVDKQLYVETFRTSKYNTFNAKLNAITTNDTYTDVIPGWNIRRLFTFYMAPEMFDKLELDGGDGFGPMVRIMADPNQPWMKQYNYPLIYQHYPQASGVSINWRDTDVLGIPPYYAIEVLQDGKARLTEGQIISNNAPTSSGEFRLKYDLPFVVYSDYDEIRNQLANLYPRNRNSLPSPIKRLLLEFYQELYPAVYKVKVEYVLPGRNTVTTSRFLNMNWQ